MRPVDGKRFVVKTGSSLVAGEGGSLHAGWMASLADDVAAWRIRGREVILVSSGAVALGRTALGLPAGKLKLEQKQAAAACGQIALMQAWQAAFAPHGCTVAQLLLTRGDSDDRRRYLNARNTLETLLAAGVVPIVNENDTIATAEIRVGDNDRLAARVAQMASAERLILLSDIDGLYTANPASDPSAVHVPQVETIDDSVRAMAGGAVSMTGTGGMATKIEAAAIATAAGCTTIIARGTDSSPLSALESGARCTSFPAHLTPRSARKEWLAGALSPQGELTVDSGAMAALAKGGSLLPAGVTNVAGRFHRGDAVLIIGPAGERVAKGLCAYGSEEAARIAGKRSDALEALLGYKGRDAIVHRDDLVLL